jgi:LacI family gluconate utilization system Gnt-I transcriptional repressor
MQDVAKLAGVSSMTVSRAFKRDTSISQATREMIMEAADKLGYVLDSTAAGLSSRKTGFVAVTIPSINNANFADTVRGLTEQLRESDLQILLGYTDYNAEEEERLLEQLLRRRPEAIVVTGGTHTERCRRLLESSGVPVVETWDIPQKPIGHVVGFSNAQAAALMVNHFSSRGYQRMAFIGGDTSRDTRGLDRRNGFMEALRERGLDDTRLIASGPPPITMREGAAAMRELLSRWPDTEAVMCVSDLSAFGALTECQRIGMGVPQGIAISGFGAYEVAEMSVPAITTIDVAARDIGRLTGEIVLQVLADPDAQSRALVRRIEPKLIVRETT